MEKTINTESTISLDLLPTEIIFIIFEYLSSNDIIYTFTRLSQRFEYLLLQNCRYLSYFELPTSDLNKWKNILSTIEYQIECLNIDSIDLSFPLSHFPNLKSLIISSPNELTEDEWKFIFQTPQFLRLHSLKIKENKFHLNEYPNNHLTNYNYVLKNVFNSQNCLKIFSCSLTIPSLSRKLVINFLPNFILHSLTLILAVLEDLFPLIEYTPNLTYLNVQIRPSLQFRLIDKLSKSTNEININLKEFHLKLGSRLSMQTRWICKPFEFDQLINSIKLFSSSLICLSLDLTGVIFTCRYESPSPFYSLKLQEFLEPMKQLKKFHLYAYKYDNQLSNNLILSQFQNEFWFNHNWSFGMYENYLFTLPFHFDYLYDFGNDFNNVQSNNNELLRTNTQLWYKVKSIELRMTHRNNIHFLKELKIKMSKLTFIKFLQCDSSSEFISIDNQFENNNFTLNNVTTIQLTDGSIEDKEQWIINLLPNLNHLIISSAEFPSKQSQLTDILNRKIKKLGILDSWSFILLSKTRYIYFSAVEYINSWIGTNELTEKTLPNIILELLKNFNRLKILTIYFYPTSSSFNSNHLNNLIDKLNISEAMNNYHVNIRKNILYFQKNL